jgi:hypothetical protein
MILLRNVVIEMVFSLRYALRRNKVFVTGMYCV